MRHSEIAVDIIIMIFMDMECFREVQFEYRVRFANNFNRMKIKGMSTFPAMFNSAGFIGFLISNTKFVFI